MSTAAPLTPVRQVGTNRSFTVPVRSTNPSHAQPTAEIGSAEGIETLYVHPNAKIVKFNSGPGSRPGSSSKSAAGSQNGGGTLPWATVTEHTLAAGPLEIYRVPGSVSFLHSGSLLHAIMPRSNCWCVDGVSKFAMRVLTDTYYRIELPGESQEELEKVEVFKETLKKVLFYERTPCPFARTFTVDLPEEEKPVRRKRRSTHGPAKKWKLHSAYSWKPEDGSEPPQQSTSEEDSGSMSDEEEDHAQEANMAYEDVAEDPELAARMKELAVQAPHWRASPRPTVRERIEGLSMRSVTAPVRSPMPAASPSPLKPSIFPNVDNVSAHQDSTHQEQSENRTYQAIPTAMPPSPPDSSTGFEHQEQPQLCASITDKNDVPSETLQLEAALAPVESILPPVMFEDVAVEQELSEHLEEFEGIAGERSETNSMQHSIDTCPPPSDGPAEPSSTIETRVDTLSKQNRIPEPASVPRTPDTRSSFREHTLESIAPLQVNTTNTTSQDPAPELARAPQTPTSSSPPTDLPLERLPPKDSKPASDPFAQIQARIQARRSIGGTTTFVPPGRSPTRQSSFSTASSTSSSLSRHRSAPQQQQGKQSQNAMASALARKACTALLGPPAHLVVLMLKIAARFARGVFPTSLMFRSPKGSVRRVPGSFDLDGSDVESWDSEDQEVEAFEEMEDDFGVKIGGPIRLASRLRERRVRDGIF